MAAPYHPLVLIGGGHAHLAVLADWILKGAPAKGAALVTPNRYLVYSGMVPGWIAGQYRAEEGRIDLAALAERAGAALILDRCDGMNADARTLYLESGGALSFDWCSIDAGGVGRGTAVLGEDPRLIDTRPMAGLVETVEQDASPRPEEPGRIAVVGGGAGGVELAFAFRNRLNGGSRPSVTLVTGRDGLLPEFGCLARRLAANELAAQGIAVVLADARLEAGCLIAGDALIEPVGRIVAALGSGAPAWPSESGLAVDDQGFIAVDRHQRSVSHPHVFAVGDIAARQDRAVPHSGVHAVHAGPVLAANLRAALSGAPPSRSYRPRPASLYLLSTGNGAAIASYGPLAARGRWAARLKTWIDKRWIASYARLAGDL